MPYNIQRTVGLELECAGEERLEVYRANFATSGISNVVAWSDCSVGRGIYTGYEFKFNGGISGVEVERTVLSLINYMRRKKYVVKNVGAGMHLHLNYNIEDKYNKALNLIDIADSIYPFILTKVNKYRHKSQYCIPLNDFNSSIHEFINWIKPSERFKDKHSLSPEYTCQRIYKGYWIHSANVPCSKRTVEVRIHEATSSPMKIMTWIEFWSAFSLACDEGRIDIIKNKDEYNSMIRSLPISSNTRLRFLCK